MRGETPKAPRNDFPPTDRRRNYVLFFLKFFFHELGKLRCVRPPFPPFFSILEPGKHELPSLALFAPPAERRSRKTPITLLLLRRIFFPESISFPGKNTEEKFGAERKRGGGDVVGLTPSPISTFFSLVRRNHQTERKQNDNTSSCRFILGDSESTLNTDPSSVTLRSSSVKTLLILILLLRPLLTHLREGGREREPLITLTCVQDGRGGGAVQENFSPILFRWIFEFCALPPLLGSAQWTWLLSPTFSQKNRCCEFLRPADRQPCKIPTEIEWYFL